MTFLFEIQNATLEGDQNQPPPPLPRIPSRKSIGNNNNNNNSSTSTIRTNGNILLDQINRSTAGNTPVTYHNKKLLNHKFSAIEVYDKDETEYELDIIRQNDTDHGYAGFGISPYNNVGDDLATYSFTTNANESLLLTGKGEGFGFLFDNKDDIEQDENVTSNLQKQPRKLSTPLKSFLVGPAERMFRLLDSQQQQRTSTKSNTIDATNQHYVSTTPLSPMQYSPNGDTNYDEYISHWQDDDEVIEFTEPMSLLDVNDDDDDDEEEEDYDDDNGTHTNSSYTQHDGGTDDGSYYNSDDYEDDETLLTMDDDDDEEYDDDDDVSKIKGTINGVESFLDELAEVEDVRDLGSFLYQVGSCNFHSNSSKTAYDANDEEEYTVSSDTFRKIHSINNNNNNTNSNNAVHIPIITKTNSAQQQHHDTNNHNYSIPPRAVSTSSSFVEGTTDTIAHLLLSMSESTETLFDIMGASSSKKKKRNVPDIANPSLNTINDTQQKQHETGTTTTIETPNYNTNKTFFQSIFNCHAG